MNFVKQFFLALFGASTKRLPAVKTKRSYNPNCGYDSSGYGGTFGNRVNTDGTPMQPGGVMDIRGRPFGSTF